MAMHLSQTMLSDAIFASKRLNQQAAIRVIITKASMNMEAF